MSAASERPAPRAVGRFPGAGARELLAATLVLSAVAVAVFQHFVRNASFYGDDWVFASTYRFADDPRFLEAARSVGDLLGGRPLFPFLVVAEHGVLGTDATLHATLSIALSIATSVALFLLLRTAGLRPFDALAVALLALLFPWADAGRFWPVVAVVGNAAVATYLLGATVALRGLCAVDERRGRLLHAVAIGLYVLSLALYETAAGVILGGVLLYRTRAGWPKAFRRWVVDLAVVVPLLALSALRTADVRSVASLGDRVSAVPEYAKAAVTIAAEHATPPALDGSAGRVVAAGAVAVILGWAFTRSARKDSEVVFWRGAALAGMIAVPLAYLPYLGYYLDPLAPGAGNRINLVAAGGYALFTYSVVRLLGRWVGRARPRIEATLVWALTVAIAAASVVRLGDDAGRWIEAGDRQRQILSAIGSAFPRPAPGTTIYVFGFDREEAPDVPVFGDRYDLDAAVELQAGDPRVHVYPVFDGVRLVCLARRVYPTGRKYGEEFGAQYPRVFLFDVESRRRVRIDDAGACIRGSRSFRPGAFWAASARGDRVRPAGREATRALPPPDRGPPRA